MRAAASRSNRTNRPAVIVIPDRDVPGLRASAWAAPMSDGVAGLQVLDLAIARHPVGDAEQQPAEDQRDGDDRRRAEVLVDRVLEHAPRPPPPAPSTAAAATRRAVGVAPARRPQRGQSGPDVADEVVAEVDDGGDQRADVQGDVERLLDALVRRSRPS